ncbi:MAG: hypothetical protein IPK60_03925 [Sandaracinaceae bacterium]|nr:hypothetical protein [Sandaracinaceae bacterium]
MKHPAHTALALLGALAVSGAVNLRGLAQTQAPAARPSRAAVDVCLDLRMSPVASTPSGQEAAVVRARAKAAADLHRLAPASARIAVRAHPGASCVMAIIEGTSPQNAMSVCNRLVARYQQEGPSLPILDSNGGRTSAVSISQGCRPFGG